MKLQQQKNGQFSLTIPKDIVLGFGWEKGDRLEFKIVGAGKIEISKKII